MKLLVISVAVAVSCGYHGHVVDADRHFRRLASTGLPTAPSGGWVNPGKDTFTAQFYTIGDYGATLEAQGSKDVDTTTGKSNNPQCALAQAGWGSRVNAHPPYAACGSSDWWRHWHGQTNVAYMIGQAATKVAPLAIITHGDNFYWDGVQNPKSAVFQAVYEGIYTSPALLNVPWLMVLGNHDVGGSGYVCGSDPGTLTNHDDWHAACGSASDTANGMNQFVTAAQTYVSPQNNRWNFGGSYYKKTFTTSDGITIDIYNIDTNVADVHGVNEICCQCFGYATDTTTCENVGRGQSNCAPTEIYDSCVATITSWFTTAVSKLLSDVQASTSVWKIVNTHYCPLRHFAVGNDKYNSLVNVLKGNINAYLCGHTHAFAHDYDATNKIHYFMNGVGGGITVESAGALTTPAATTVFSAGGTYGYLDISASKGWLKVQFQTADSSWNYAQTVTPGGVSTAYCTYVPISGDQAVACSNAAAWVPPTSASPTNSQGSGNNQQSSPSPGSPSQGSQTGDNNNNSNNLSASKGGIGTVALVGIIAGSISLVAIIAVFVIWKKRKSASYSSNQRKGSGYNYSTNETPHAQQAGIMVL